MFLPRSLIPVLERNEHGRRIGTPGIEDEVQAGESLCPVNGRDREKILFDLLQDVISPLLRRAVRELHDGDEVALILFRQKGHRHGLEQTHRDGDHHAKIASERTLYFNVSPTLVA